MLWLCGFIRKQQLYGANNHNWCLFYHDHLCFNVCLEWTKVALIFTLLTVTFSHRSLTDTARSWWPTAFLPSSQSERHSFWWRFSWCWFLKSIPKVTYCLLPFTQAIHLLYAPTLIFWMMLIILFLLCLIWNIASVKFRYYFVPKGDLVR